VATSDRDGGWWLLRVIASFLADIWSFAIFSLLAPRTNHVDEERETPVKSLTQQPDPADDPLERRATSRHLVEHTGAGSETGWEVETVSNEFLTQLEQRTQQVKITLANLEAEKVRIEGMIVQLQPLVPHYDALLGAERQLSEANITLEAAQRQRVEEAAPAESSGWASDAPGVEQESSGWAQ
jgi:hypothetical protein